MASKFSEALYLSRLTLHVRHSDTSKLLAYCLRPGCAGKPFVEQIKPGDNDYCILKPMHSAFYQIPI